MSAFEWVQNQSNLRWEEDEVNRQLDRKMTDAFAKVWQLHQTRRVNLLDLIFNLL